MHRIRETQIFTDITSVSAYEAPLIKLWPHVELLDIVLQGGEDDTCSITVQGYNSYSTGSTAFPLAILNDKDYRTSEQIEAPGSYKADVSGCVAVELIVNSLTTTDGLSCKVIELGG